MATAAAGAADDRDARIKCQNTRHPNDVHQPAVGGARADIHEFRKCKMPMDGALKRLRNRMKNARGRRGNT